MKIFRVFFHSIVNFVTTYDRDAKEATLWLGRQRDNLMVGTSKLQPNGWDVKYATLWLERQSCNRMVGTSNMQPYGLDPKEATSWLGRQRGNLMSHKL